jgi:hypothetical protein
MKTRRSTAGKKKRPAKKSAASARRAAPKSKTKPKSKRPARRAKPAARKKTTARKRTTGKITARKTTAKKLTTRKTAAKKKAPATRRPVTRKAPATKRPRAKALLKPRVKTVHPSPPPAAYIVPANESKVGVVTHYYSHLNVAVISVTDRPMQVGERIHVKGHTSDFFQTVTSIEVDHQSRLRAEVGQAVGLKVTDHAREHDVVYRVA